MTLPKRSLTAQVDEISRTIAERTSARRNSADDYRLDTLKAIHATLIWLETHAETIKLAARGMTFTQSISPHSATSSSGSAAQQGGGDGDG